MLCMCFTMFKHTNTFHVLSVSSSWVQHFTWASNSCHLGAAKLVSQVISNPVGNMDMGRAGGVRLLAEFQSAALEGYCLL